MPKGGTLFCGVAVEFCDRFICFFHDVAIAAPFIDALENKSKIVVVVSLLPGTMKLKTSSLTI